MTPQRMTPQEAGDWEQHKLHIVSELQRIGKETEYTRTELSRVHARIDESTNKLLEKLEQSQTDSSREHATSRHELAKIKTELATWKGKLWGFGTAAGLIGTVLGYLIQYILKKV